MKQISRETAAGRAYLDLRNEARRQGRPTQELLTYYAIERWLARLEASRYATAFVLKGGVLLVYSLPSAWSSPGLTSFFLYLKGVPRERIHLSQVCIHSAR